MLLAVRENRNATRQQPRTFGLETHPRSFGLLVSSSERVWECLSRLDRRGRGDEVHVVIIGGRNVVEVVHIPSREGEYPWRLILED